VNISASEKPFVGRFLSRGCPRGPIHFSSLRVSLFDLAKPFLRPDPQSRRAGAHRSGHQGWARVAPHLQGLVLDGFEHNGTLVVIGMMKCVPLRARPSRRRGSLGRWCVLAGGDELARGYRRKCKHCLKLFRPDPRNLHDETAPHFHAGPFGTN
jgi:hypothetical protein